MKKKLILRGTITFLLFLMTSLILYKVVIQKYRFEDIIPSASYKVTLSMSFKGYGDDVIIRTYLPAQEPSQVITEQVQEGPNTLFRQNTHSDTTSGEWSVYNADGPYTVSYSFRAGLKEVRYTVDEELRIPEVYSPHMKGYLNETDVIQVHHEEIAALAKELKDSENRISATLKNYYDYVLGFESRAFKGTTDALTALRLKAASCNGKSRLFVALARHAGLPARLTGGLILNTGNKKTTHQWAEVWVGGHWIPFDTLNDHFMVKPDNYLALYRGDKVMFKYTANIGFNYNYDIKKQIVSNSNLEKFLGGNSLNLYNFLHSFKRVNISLNLLKLILMIPVGVLIVVIFRNIIGINTFGTFLPALMAVAVRDTGLSAGLIAFVMTILIVCLIRYPLQKLGILHTPKLAIMMIGVVISLFALTIIADYAQSDIVSRLGAASLFPVAILTITSERFALSIEEEGMKDTLLMMVQTLLVMSLCYYVMNSLAIQTLMLAFPEIILGIAAMNLWIGSWIGIRVTELIRFKSLLNKEWSV